MTNVIIEEFEAVWEKVKTALTPAAQVVEADVEDIASKAWTYIKTNGLQDAYQIALSIVGAAIAGAPWVGTLEAIEAAVIADGKEIAKGAVAVVAAQAQADLISVGTLLPPVSSS